MQEEFIRLPADELLKRFGAGSHKPGSGSAAALDGLLAAALVKTVISLTERRPDGYADANLAEQFERRVLEIEDQLAEDFQSDSYLFDDVISARRARDAARAAGDEHLAEHHYRQALEHQRTCTDIPLRVATLCMELADIAQSVFDLGFRGARGDSVVALTTALAGASGAVGVVYLNLKDYQRPSEWSRRVMSMTAALDGRIENGWRAVARCNAELRAQAVQDLE